MTYLEVTTATPTREAAIELATGAVTARLAGNAQVVGPVVSVFWHLGEHGMGEEWRLVLFTTGERYPALEEYLRASHPWKNPQVTATAIVAGSEDCLTWLRRSVGTADPTQ